MKTNMFIWIALLLPFLANSQELKKISPDNSKAGKTLTVTITGKKTHFLQGSGTAVYFTGGVVNSFQLLDNKKIEASITIPVNTPTGIYHVTVYNSIDGTHQIPFSVKGVPVPQLVSIDPSSANAGQTLDVTITGVNTHFKKEKNEVRFGFSQATPTITVVNNNILKARITVPATTVTGDYTVSVSNAGDGYLRLDSFRVNGIVVPQPSLQSVSPSIATPGETLSVTITGINTHFDVSNGTRVWFHFNSGTSTIVLNSIAITSLTSLQANILVPTDANIGNYTVEVKNTDDGSLLLPNGFKVQRALPEIIYVSAPGAFPGQTADVAIITTRTHYLSSAPVVKFDFGTGTLTESDTVIVQDDSILFVKVKIPPQTITGIHKIIVTNSVDGQLTGNLNVLPICHTYFTTSYDSIANSFTLMMDSLTSQDLFINWDFGDGTFSYDPNPIHTFAHNRYFNVCLTTINWKGDTCKYCRVIGKDSLGNILTRVNGFTAKMEFFTPSTIARMPAAHVDQAISIYPNPARDAITLSVSNAMVAKESTVSIYGVDGKLLKQQRIQKNTFEINITDLEPGMYIIQTTGDSKLEMNKFIKE